MAESALYLARRPFGHLGLDFGRDQVLSLDQPDDALVTSGMVIPVPADAHVVTCSVCGARFVAAYALRLHTDRQHRG